jgi:hypothetical protein
MVDVGEPDGQAIGRIASRVQLEAIDLNDAIFRAPEDRDDAPEPDNVGIETRFGMHDGEIVFWLAFRMIFDGYDIESEEEPYVIQARFRLRYKLAEDYEANPEDVAQFGRWNALFNVWPYWREFVQSTTDRAGMKRMTVGLMGLPVVDQHETTPSE